MLYNDFEEALAAGKIGENMGMELMNNLGFEVTDTSKNPEYYAKDIDFLATLGEIDMQVEVKSDAQMGKTGNAVIELISNKETNRPGWYYYTEASHLFYVDITNSLIHSVRVNELKDYYEKNKNRLQIKDLHNWEQGIYYKESRIALVPIVELQDFPHYACYTVAGRRIA